MSKCIIDLFMCHSFAQFRVRGEKEKVNCDYDFHKTFIMNVGGMLTSSLLKNLQMLSKHMSGDAYTKHGARDIGLDSPSMSVKHRTWPPEVAKDVRVSFNVGVPK